MIIDLHVHTTISGDSTIDPEAVVQLARNAGLDGVCITEHGKEKSKIAEGLALRYDFPVFGGMETSTELGDLLVFGVDFCPWVITKAKELRDFVSQCGGVIVAAHPFRSKFLRSVRILDVTVGDACKYPFIEVVDAIEVFNGWSTGREVEFCSEVSAMVGLPGTGGSDAHVPWQLGSCVTVFDHKIRSEAELVDALKSGAFHGEDRRDPEFKIDPMNWFSDSMA